VQLTDRDLEIIDILVHRVRVLSYAQVARTWWTTATHAIPNAARRLNQLAEAGFLHCYSALAHPEIELLTPVVTWIPGAPAPLMGPVAYRLSTRWNKPPVLTHFIIATAATGRRFGGHGGRVPREKEQTHDLHLSAVFLHFRSQLPESVNAWQSEARLLRNRQSRTEKLPDAILNLDSGPRVIEFGGAYPKAKLERFHKYWTRFSTPYEVW